VRSIPRWIATSVAPVTSPQPGPLGPVVQPITAASAPFLNTGPPESPVQAPAGVALPSDKRTMIPPVVPTAGMASVRSVPAERSLPSAAMPKPASTNGSPGRGSAASVASRAAR
jgi:hypothetical protein